MILSRIVLFLIPWSIPDFGVYYSIFATNLKGTPRSPH